MKTWFTGAAVATLMATLSACAEIPQDPEDRAEFDALNDPLEPMNRAVFSFNTAADEAVLQPIARTYRSTLPESAQRSVHNVINNLRSPVIFANDTLQAEPERAGDTLIRFLINSTAGLFGLFDVVGDTGGPRFHSEDFGQTLAVWGIEDGPYLVLPLFGPSNPRDAAGLGVEWFADPADLALANQGLEWVSWTRFGVGVVDERAALLDPVDELKRGSLDFYAAIRSVYRQQRASEIANKDISLADAFKKGNTR